jgi:hypothetical protein
MSEKAARTDPLLGLLASLTPGMSQKVYKPLPPCLSYKSIDLIDRRNHRKMSKPERVFKMGPVRASIFQNTAHKNGKDIQFPKVVLEVRYRDQSGEWKGTNSLSLNDLPKAILALQKAYEYLMEKRNDSTELHVTTEKVE